MNISMQLFLVLAACLCLSEGAPDGRLVRKQQRPTRGFKNVEMMTARGFGKRDRSHTRAERDIEHASSEERTGRSSPTFKSPTINVARDFGKRAPEMENEDTFDTSPRKIFKPRDSLMVAYDFGKRSGYDNSDEEEEIRVTRGTFRPSGKVLIARGYGKRIDEGVVDMDDFLETLASSPEKEPETGDDKNVESMPLDLLVMEMMNNPEFTRSVVRKFIDVNQDGVLSLEELLRNVA